MPAHHIVVAGLGRIGLQLLQRIAPEFTLVCIDPDEEACERARTLRPENCTVVRGDATSRLVLQDAGLAAADAVVITMTKERLTLEVTRLVHEHFQTARMIAVGITPDGIAALQNFGAEVVNVFQASVVGIINVLEHKARTAHGIGLEPGEIREVEVHPNSKFVHKSISSLASPEWRIGMMYRGGSRLLPTGDTVLEPRDRVIVLGAPAVVNRVADMLMFRFYDFPHEYGSALLAWAGSGADDVFFNELLYVVETFRMRAVMLAGNHPSGSSAAKPADDFRTRCPVPVECMHVHSPAHMADAGGCVPGRFGCIALPKKALMHSRFALSGSFRAKATVVRLLNCMQAPVLLSCGSAPYTHAAAVCIHDSDSTHILEHAFEMSSLLNSLFTALVVRPEPYIASAAESECFELHRRQIRMLSTAYKMKIEIEELSGNPVHAVAAAAVRFNLLLADGAAVKRVGVVREFFNPDALWRSVVRAGVSTLLLPEAEHSL